MKKILFICHGNICRSPMAEFVLKDMISKKGLLNKFTVSSAATSTEEIGNDVHPGTKRILVSKKICFSKRCAVQMTKKDYIENDYILAMDSVNIINILKIIGEDKDNKVFRLLDFSNNPRDIADPWYTGNFDITYNDIIQGCEAFINRIL